MSTKKPAPSVTDTPANPAATLEVTAAGAAVEIPGELGTRPDDSEPGVAIEAGVSDPANIPPSAYIIRALRPQGVWRAGRFWGPDEVKVRADQITPEQEVQLITEPLLLTLPLIETQE